MRNKKRVMFAVIAATAAAVSTAAFFVKRHAVKGRKAMFALIAAVMLCGVIAAPMTAYAYTDENAEREVDLDEILTPVVTPAPTPEPTPIPEPQPLTPDGNLTLVDDISGEQANDKQFVTVVTKSGAYFYLVIDRAGDRENVYFLNLVDEADLLAIIEKDKKPVPVTPAPVETTPEPTPAPDPAPEPKKSNTTGLLIMLLLIGVLGGGAAYYFKVIKPKQGAAKSTAATELDDFVFDDDEDEYSGGEPDGGEYEDGGEIPDFTISEPPAPDSPLDDYGDDFTFGVDESEGKE